MCVGGTGSVYVSVFVCVCGCGGGEEKYTFGASVTDLKKLILSCLCGVGRKVYISSLLAQRNKYIVAYVGYGILIYTSTSWVPRTDTSLPHRREELEIPCFCHLDEKR